MAGDISIMVLPPLGGVETAGVTYLVELLLLGVVSNVGETVLPRHLGHFPRFFLGLFFVLYLFDNDLLNFFRFLQHLLRNHSSQLYRGMVAEYQIVAGEIQVFVRSVNPDLDLVRQAGFLLALPFGGPANSVGRVECGVHQADGAAAAEENHVAATAPNTADAQRFRVFGQCRTTGGDQLRYLPV